MHSRVRWLSAIVAMLLLAVLTIGLAPAAFASASTNTLVFASPITPPPPPPPPQPAPGYHIVRPHETLYSISRLYGVSVWALAAANHLANPNIIYVGQRLYIPGRGVPVPPAPPYPPTCGRYHIVRYGQTLYGIGRLYGVSAWSIASANGLYNINLIYSGQRLLIPCR